MTDLNTRQADHPIDPQFVARWSPRVFKDEPIPEATLLSFLEAARWAPSAYNAQPWRFVYARRGTPHWEPFVGFLNEFNQRWARHAAALVLVISKSTFTPPGSDKEVPAPTHSFDAGSAWAYLALQASLSGWATHGMAGIEHDRIRNALDLSPEYKIEAAIAIGRPGGDLSALPEGLRARELPSQREPLAKIASEGRFAF
ncbi:nitroreductase family protein [Pandoraea anhela]|uniref:NADH dehydrogenase n=1 Tax=Pandoraea anhela TaxID=2508295 RepID=A0A5E4W0M1_9BURK|nr:nitroreductase family protein [Pandoraea anhela]VVE17673.1 NADH dehydrogenase [Pandoraea anhela]